VSLKGLATHWSTLGVAHRITLGAALVLVPLLVVLGAIAAHPASVALFATPLRSDQMQEVEERLASWSVPFTPTQDNVTVEAARRNDLLLRLSLAGVPHRHITDENEALAAVGALTPQSVIDAQTLEGREGDIASALRDVAGISDASVIIAPAAIGEFGDQSGTAASASVRLHLEPGTQLADQTLTGIRAFVAAAVAGLQPARVTILDDRGAALDATSAGSDAAGLQGALQSALDAAFGAGATIVRVHADYAQQAVERHDVVETPALGPSIDRTASARTYERGGERYREDSEQTTRATRTQETTTNQPSGTLARISTAVFVDASHAGDVMAIRDLAAATVGFDPQRGDTLAVQAVDFARIPASRKDLWWLLYGAIVPLLPTLVCVGGALFALWLLAPSIGETLCALGDRLHAASAARRAPEMPAAQVRSLLATEPPHAAAAVISALPAATAAAVLEMYPPHEREAIVRRMNRIPPPLIPDPGELLRDSQRHG
jgi:flagellar M-ring protein FliF